MSVRQVRNLIFEALPPASRNPDVISQERDGDDTILIHTCKYGTKDDPGPVFRVTVQKMEEGQIEAYRWARRSLECICTRPDRGGVLFGQVSGRLSLAGAPATRRRLVSDEVRCMAKARNVGGDMVIDHSCCPEPWRCVTEKPRQAPSREGPLFICYFCGEDAVGGKDGNGVLLQRRNGDTYPICRECWEWAGKAKGWDSPTSEQETEIEHLRRQIRQYEEAFNVQAALRAYEERLRAIAGGRRRVTDSEPLTPPTKSDCVRRDHEPIEKLRQWVAEHYPDGTNHDPEYSRPRYLMSAALRHHEELLKQRDELEAALTAALKHWDRRIGSEAVSNERGEVDDWNRCVALTGYQGENESGR